MKVLTPKEAARVLRLGIHTLYRYAREGRIPGRRLGKHWRFVQEDLESFLREPQAPYHRAGLPPENENPIERAREFGIDLTLLEENLRLTPTERLKKHAAALDLMQEARRAGERMRDRDRRKTAS